MATQTLNGRLTVTEAAQYLDVHPHMMYDLRYAGTLQGTKDGKRVYFTREELDAYAKQRDMAQQAQEAVGAETPTPIVAHPLVTQVEQEVMGKVVELITERVQAQYDEQAAQEHHRTEELVARLRRIRSEIDEVLDMYPGE